MLILWALFDFGNINELKCVVDVIDRKELVILIEGTSEVLVIGKKS